MNSVEVRKNAGNEICGVTLSLPTGTMERTFMDSRLADPIIAHAYALVEAVEAGEITERQALDKF